MFGKILNYHVKDNQIFITFEKEKGIINLLSSKIIQLKEEKSSVFSTNSINEFVKVNYSTNFLNGVLSIKTADYLFEISDNFKLTVIKDDKIISSEKEVEYVLEEDNVNYELLELEGHKALRGSKAHKVTLNKKISVDDMLYGLGEKTGFLNKRDYEYEMWNTDDPSVHAENYRALYKSIPFYITFNQDYVYGYFIDNTYKQYYDMAKTNYDCVSIGFDKGYFNYYFIGGNSIKEVVSNYTKITGRTPLPQRFTLGHQQCRWSYMNQEELRLVAEKFRKLQIPCDVLFCDIDYMERYKVFTYNKETFSDFPKMIEEFKKDGYKLVTIIDPGVKIEEGYDIYEELIKDELVATKDGKTYVNAVWPGDSVFPAFTNPKTRDFWASKIKVLTDLGVSGIWNDMNEPASFKGPLPDDVEFMAADGIHYHDEVHNVYGHYMAQATYEGLKEHTNKRPYIITRACFAGTQKYSTVWTGDNHSIWPHLQMGLPMLINLGLSGMAFCGTDVGGFSGDCTKELLCRWVQLGTFTPLFRNHSAMGTRHQEPWSFDEETVDIYRKAVNLRYKLIPYFYDLFYEGSKNGLPILRPLVMHYENDSNTYEINDEALVGEQILISPIMQQGARKKMVYLPQGAWYDLETKEEYQGGYQIVDANLDKIPAFVKEGSIIPNYPIKQFIDDEDILILDIYPGKGTYTHYQDNGEDFNYLKGEYNLYEIIHDDNKLSIKLIHNGYKTYKKIILKYLENQLEITEYNQEIIIE